MDNNRSGFRTYLSLWKVRLKLFWGQFKTNWGIFLRTGYGPFGLTVVFLFFIAALSHPILMATVWDRQVYDPVIGLAEKEIHDLTSTVNGEVSFIHPEILRAASDAPDATAAQSEERVYKNEVIFIITDDLGVEHPIQVSDSLTPKNLTVGFGDSVSEGDVLVGLEDVYPLPPSSKHLLGVAPTGQDILSQILFSTQNEFVLGLIAALSTLIVGTTVGAVAAYFGGWLDALLMRLADLILMLPAIAFLIVLGAIFNLQFWNLALVVGVLGGLGGVAIILKSQALTVTVKPYIDAARVGGSGHMRIIFRHIAPNLLPLAFLYMMFTVTAAVFSEATLSFFGVLNINVSWGLILSNVSSQGYLNDPSFWWLAVPTGVVITLFAGSFYLIGRGIEPIVNPKLRRR